MNYKRITVNTLAKIAIGLLVIIGICVFTGTFKSNSFETVSYLNNRISDLKEDVLAKEAAIEQVRVDLDEATQKLPGLKQEEADAKTALTDATLALEEVCDRNYFSTFFCTEVCQQFHNEVTIAKNKHSLASDTLSSCERTISNAEYDIENYTEDIAELEDDIKTVSAEKTKAIASAFFLVIAMISALAGLVFAIMFLLDRDNTKKGLIACAIMAGSSMLYIFADTKTSFITYLLGFFIFGIYAVLISKKTQKRVMARVFVIILSLILFVVTLLSAPFTALIAAIAFILISLVLVPCVFTEYLDIAKHIFFTIITFGIWHLIWMYNFTENLNKVEETEKRAPIRELVLCAFLPLYYIFWMYKTAENTELYGKEKGKNFKIGILCLALAVINPLLASVIIQDKTNVIVGKPVAPAPAEEVSAEAKTEE